MAWTGANVGLANTFVDALATSGLEMYEETRMTTIEKVMLNDRDMSSNIGGTGIIMSPRMSMIPAARRISLLFCRFSSMPYPLIPFPFIR